MSQHQQQRSPLADFVAITLMIATIILLSVFFLFSFVAFAMTILAICAWSKPVQFGRFRIEPERAQMFVVRGFFVGCALVSFVALAALVFKTGLTLTGLVVTFVLGYSLGSLGVEAIILYLAAKAGPAVPAQTAPTNPALPAKPEQFELLPQSERSFRYATWDDEERRG